MTFNHDKFTRELLDRCLDDLAKKDDKGTRQLFWNKIRDIPMDQRGEYLNRYLELHFVNKHLDYSKKENYPNES